MAERKVPEAVLEAFYTMLEKEPLDDSVAAALDAYDELLRGDNAGYAAWKVGKSKIESQDRKTSFPRWRGMVQAAIDSVRGEQ